VNMSAISNIEKIAEMDFLALEGPSFIPFFSLMLATAIEMKKGIEATPTL